MIEISKCHGLLLWGCVFFAAANGSMEMLEWARANESPWNGDTCAEAAKKGDLELLQWAIANGCPYRTICVVVPPDMDIWK
jgi:hypothetical protein